MPSQFCVKYDGEVEWLPFTRRHLAEITGEPVPPNKDYEESVELTSDQAWDLIDKWNEIAALHDGAQYSL